MQKGNNNYTVPIMMVPLGILTYAVQVSTYPKLSPLTCHPGRVKFDYWEREPVAYKRTSRAISKW